MAPPTNPTGFNMKTFTDAATSPQWRAKDPWAKKYERPRHSCKHILTIYSEAWRYSGPFTRWNRFKGAFPGLGIAVVAFTGYVVFEQLFLKDSHGHAEAHGEKH